MHLHACRSHCNTKQPFRQQTSPRRSQQDVGVTNLDTTPLCLLLLLLVVAGGFKCFKVQNIFLEQISRKDRHTQDIRLTHTHAHAHAHTHTHTHTTSDFLSFFNRLQQQVNYTWYGSYLTLYWMPVIEQSKIVKGQRSTDIRQKWWTRFSSMFLRFCKMNIGC